MKQPAIKKIIFTIKRNVNWLVAMFPSNSDAACATPNCVHTKENKDAHATIIMIPPVVLAESIMMSHMSFKDTSL